MIGNKKQRISLLGVPLGFGAGSPGSDLGINAMRVSRIRGRSLPDRIRGLGYELIDRGDVHIVTPESLETPGNPKHLAEMIASSNNIVATLTEVLEEGDFPIILGGDHAIAIPTFSAIAAHYRRAGQEIGLIWFDAHADINTPETSPTGNIHGMPLAAILGRGHPDLTDICGFSPKVDPRFVAHIGARDVDEGERGHVHDLGLRDNFLQ